MAFPPDSYSALAEEEMAQQRQFDDRRANMKGYDPRNHVPTQHMRILWYLNKHGSITLLECMQALKITKLQTRLGELRKKGYVFPEQWEGKGATRYKRYFAPTRIPRAA